MKNYKISIPEPCHENWDEMTINDKGRFCSSCSKTVIDFTKKESKQIQEYLKKHQEERICGHFFKKQLDSIVIELPESIFERELSFHKLFVIVLVFVMGTTLLSCNTEGKIQKIEHVTLIDSVKKAKKSIDSSFIFNKKDSIEKDQPLMPKVNKEKVSGEIVVGKLPPPPNVTGLVIRADTSLDSPLPLSFSIVKSVPRFRGVVKRANETWKENFNRKMQEFVVKNFDTISTLNLGLSKGKKRMYAQFTINSKGSIINVKTRTPHPKLNKTMEELIKKLPPFVPGKNNGKPLDVIYTLPVTFMVE
ncbi:TonB-like protein [Tenacibaculum skagerrakense]|uniref:TonB-like protein n=1 Tax=Tenacibaculum skagerrakense TaxID=186571 RepID=A0A4R2NZW3_9FLAO|nr:energy transducer TonB [Tenacibaculum skagerrakense]TCP27870.1 TonB-like protein [Tenacibaculum skagerrakense]